jgi:hypothetical protein
MRTSRFSISQWLVQSVVTLAVLSALTLVTLAAEPGPGVPMRNGAETTVSDQHPASVLFFPVYTSNSTAPATENARISITNTHQTQSIGIHLFFIDGASCAPADANLCLTANQTTAFLASNFDPGTTGFIVAVAVNPTTGWPMSYNYLIGDEYVKFGSGHTANLGAQGVMGRAVPAHDPLASNATLRFDSLEYDRLPAVVAIDSLPSRVDGNDTLVVVNRVSGNFSNGADPIGVLFGLLYNDAEISASYQLNSSQCQFRFSFSNSVPRTAPRFTNHVGGGRVGWTKMNSTSGTVPLIGASINYNPASTASSTAFDSGHNFHVLRLVPSSSIVIPVIPPNCGS